MRRGNLKSRLLLFFATRLRGWANSIERKVFQPQSTQPENFEDSSRSLNDSAIDKTIDYTISPVHGAPQHWIDLIRERAPELLDLPQPQRVPLSRTEDINLGKPVQEAVTREHEQTVQHDLHNPKQRPRYVPPSGIPRVVAKPQTRPRPQSFTLKPGKKPTTAFVSSPEITIRKEGLQDNASSSLEETRRREPANRNPSSILQATTEARLKRPEATNDVRSTSSESSKTLPPRDVELPDFETTTNKGPRSEEGLSINAKQAGHVRNISSYLPSQATGQATSAVSAKFPRRNARSGLQEELHPWEVLKVTASRDTVSKQTPIVKTDARRKDHEAVIPSINKQTQKSLTQFTSYTALPLRVIKAQEVKEHFQSADVNLPALINEESMSRATTVHLSELESAENPWPDLPPPPELDVIEELVAHERESDHYLRLEREQRGILWNE